MSKKQDHVWNQYYGPLANMGANNFETNMDENRQVLYAIKNTRELQSMAMNRFEWFGAPLTVNIRYLQIQLLNRCLAVFYNDPDFGYLALSAAANGRRDMYGEPLGFQVMGSGVLQRGVTSYPTNGRTDKGTLYGVPIWSNYMRYPDWDIIYLAATKLAIIDRTIEINSEQARQTKILALSENLVLGGQNIDNEIRSGASVVVIKDTFDVNAFAQALDLNIDTNKILDLSMLRARLWNEAMGELGINGANQDKKERLVSAEVGANDEQINATRRVNLNALQSACVMINKAFPEIKDLGEDEQLPQHPDHPGMWVDYYATPDAESDDEESDKQGQGQLSGEAE